MVLSRRVLYSFLRLMKGYYKTMVHLLIFWNIPSTLFPYTYIYIDILLQSSAVAPANSGSPFYSSAVERSPGRLHLIYTRFPSSEIGGWFTVPRWLNICPWTCRRSWIWIWIVSRIWIRNWLGCWLGRRDWISCASGSGAGSTRVTRARKSGFLGGFCIYRWHFPCLNLLLLIIKIYGSGPDVFGLLVG